MHLPNRWTNKEGWLYHIKDSGIMRVLVEHIRNGDEVPLEKLEEMEFRREWMQDDGEGKPPKYDLLKSLADELKYKIENMSLITILRCRRYTLCRSRLSPYQ